MNLENRYFSVVLIGASAGGVEALGTLFSKLPSTFTSSIIVVLHQLPHVDQLAIDIFRPHSLLPIKEAEEMEQIMPGYIYFAPPGYHLLIEADKTFSISTEEAVNFSRPSIDVLFESAADVYGAAAVGVILSGASVDGAKGLSKIVESGGTALIQAPHTAPFAKMPSAAKERVPSATLIELDALAQFLSGL